MPHGFNDSAILDDPEDAAALANGPPRLARAPSDRKRFVGGVKLYHAAGPSTVVASPPPATHLLGSNQSFRRAGSLDRLAARAS